MTRTTGQIARQRHAEQSAAEHVERQRVAELVRHWDADSEDLLAEVKRLDAGEDREAVRTWAERRHREIQAEVQREIEGK